MLSQNRSCSPLSYVYSLHQKVFQKKLSFHHLWVPVKPNHTKTTPPPILPYGFSKKLKTSSSISLSNSKTLPSLGVHANVRLRQYKVLSMLILMQIANTVQHAKKPSTNDISSDLYFEPWSYEKVLNHCSILSPPLFLSFWFHKISSFNAKSACLNPDTIMLPSKSHVQSFSLSLRWKLSSAPFSYP